MIDIYKNLKAICKWLKEEKGITEIDMMELIDYIHEYEEWLKSTPKK